MNRMTHSNKSEQTIPARLCECTLAQSCLLQGCLKQLVDPSPNPPPFFDSKYESKGQEGEKNQNKPEQLVRKRSVSVGVPQMGLRDGGLSKSEHISSARCCSGPPEKGKRRACRQEAVRKRRHNQKMRANADLGWPKMAPKGRQMNRNARKCEQA